MSWSDCEVLCGKQKASYSVRNNQNPSNLFCIFSKPIKPSKIIVDEQEYQVISYTAENLAYSIVLNQPKKEKSDDDKSSQRSGVN
jgi:hypothetical protein